MVCLSMNLTFGLVWWVAKVGLRNVLDVVVVAAAAEAVVVAAVGMWVVFDLSWARIDRSIDKPSVMFFFVKTENFI